MPVTDPQKLLDLISGSLPAHKAYEAEVLKGTDDDWPAWYAAYLIQNGLNDLLGAAFTPASLKGLLIQIDGEHRALNPGGDWPEYWVRRLTELTTSPLENS